MNSPIRRSVTLGAFTLAIGLVTFAIFLVSARGGSPSMPEMCARTGPEVTEDSRSSEHTPGTPEGWIAMQRRRLRAAPLYPTP
jgi:hypothetical protein